MKFTSREESTGRHPIIKFKWKHCMTIRKQKWLNEPPLQVVYVARNPKDVIVSYYHYHRLMDFHRFAGDLETFAEYFLKDQLWCSPFFPHLIQAWNRRHHPNMLFLFYEDLKRVTKLAFYVNEIWQLIPFVLIGFGRIWEEKWTKWRNSWANRSVTISSLDWRSICGSTISPRTQPLTTNSPKILVSWSRMDTSFAKVAARRHSPWKSKELQCVIWQRGAGPVDLGGWAGVDAIYRPLKESRSPKFCLWAAKMN